jgi:N-acetylglutamate synthase-like GNAT family acetyltransferase
MNLELAKKEQSKELTNLINQSYRGKVGWTKEGHLLYGNRINQNQIEDIILDKNSYLFILKNDKNIISCCCIEKTKDSAYFGLFSVKVDIQNKGIGKKTLELSEKYVKDILALKKIKMMVISQRKELIEYYERRGYKKIKTNQKAPDIGESKIKNMTIDYLEKDLS